MKQLDTFEGSIVKNNMVPVCLNRTGDNSKVIIDGCNYNLTDYPKEEYTPIGIVVMNPLHTDARYSDESLNRGKYLIISLKLMDCDDVENGTVKNKSMYWGYNGYGFPELHNYTQFSTVNNTENEKHVNGYKSFAYIPTTYGSSDGKCATAPKLGYNGNTKAPSPYKMTVDENGLPVWGVNPLYVEGGKEKNNALSDFEGKKNTEIILSRVKNKLKQSSRIPNSHKDYNYPAATCCSRFRTEGTNSGDWWLPSCGELGYCATFHRENTATLEHINKVYGEDVSSARLNTWNWSSSEDDFDNVNLVSLSLGYIDGYSSDIYDVYVRAVTAVEADFVMTE